MDVNMSVRGTMGSGQSAAIRGGNASMGVPKQSFASKLGGAVKGIAQVGLGVAAQVVPGGNVLAGAISGAFGKDLAGAGGFGSSGGMSGAGNTMVNEMMQMNMQFLALQNALQNENRKFTTLSNASQMRHSTAKNAIQNMRG